jgi:putative tricarboxylic transport membrane protein
MISASDDPLQFLGEFFTSAISIVLVAALTLTIVSQTRLWQRVTGRGPLPKLQD